MTTEILKSNDIGYLRTLTKVQAAEALRLYYGSADASGAKKTLIGLKHCLALERNELQKYITFLKCICVLMVCVACMTGRSSIMSFDQPGYALGFGLVCLCACYLLFFILFRHIRPRRNELEIVEQQASALEISL